MRRTILILSGLVLLVTILTFTFFEVKQVPDIKKGKEYSAVEKNRNGLWLFHELLKLKYGEDSVELSETDNLDYLSEVRNSLLVIITSRVVFDSVKTKAINNFLDNGNELLITARYHFLDSLTEYDYTHTNTYIDSVGHLSWMDNSTTPYNSFSRDSTIDTRLSFRYFSKINDIGLLDLADKSRTTTITSINDTLPIFQEVEEEGRLFYLHCIPELFINIAGVTDSYLTHFNRTFSNFKSEKIILHSFGIQRSREANNDSLLKYILSQRSLKYAYYLLLIFSLLYVFFSSRRKQKAIPIIQPNKNTSLDYIHTVSDLYRAQDQNQKLVLHMRRIFYDKIRNKYFIDPDHPDFVRKLSKKSKLPIEKINSLVDSFKASDNYDFNDDQLIRLYNDIQSFYKSSQ